VIPDADALASAIKGAEITMKASPALSALLTALNDLAVSLHTVCKYDAAERIYGRALQGREEILGPEHINTLATVDGLPRILMLRGQHEAAEKMFRRALEGREKILGPEHIDTVAAVNGLAAVLMFRGQYEAPEEMFRWAMEGREKILGPEHRSEYQTEGRVLWQLGGHPIFIVSGCS
jgi:tetratricopeptide (TPR) repeat protein